MSPQRNFFDLDLHQTVNGWLCITLISLMCFWIFVLYYLDKGNTLAQSEVASYAHSTSDESTY